MLQCKVNSMNTLCVQTGQHVVAVQECCQVCLGKRQRTFILLQGLPPQVC